jgi:DNA-binding CsgD family transcriptional regulator
MVSLTEQDYQKVLDFLQKLNDPQNLVNLTAYLLESVPQLVPADIPGYCTIDFKGPSFSTKTPLPEKPGTPTTEEVAKQHFYRHPFVVHYLKTRDCGAYKLSDFVSKEKLHCMEGIYHQHLRPLGMEEQMKVNIPHIPALTHSEISHPVISIKFDSLVLFRSQRNFTERDRLILNLLLPHVIHAHQTACLLNRMQEKNQQLYACLNASGSVCVSESEHIQFISQNAEIWLKEYFPDHSVIHRLPELLTHWIRFQKSLLSQDNTSLNHHPPLKLEQNGKQLIIRFASSLTENQALLLLEEQKIPSLSVESFELLGLSKREAEVLFWAAKGKENQEIAENLYISGSTVRKHLENIYLKLNVKTRAAAVVAALEKLGLII